jgi:hypothetical protein
MPQIPSALLNLGAGVVVVFLVAAIVYLILQIIKAVRKTPAPVEITANGSRRNGWSPCFSNPIVSSLTSNQIVMMEAIKEMKTSMGKLAENSVLQTQLMDRVASVQEDIGKCMTKMETRDEMRT